MDSDTLERNADSSTARGDTDQAPAGQTDDGTQPLPNSDESKPLEIPEDMLQGMREKFRASEREFHPEAFEDEKPGQADQPDAADDSQEQPGRDEPDDEQKPGQDGADAANDGDVLDSELDEIEQALDQDKQGKAFAKMRTELRDAKAALRDSAETAQFGQNMKSQLEAIGATPESFEETMQILALSESNPMKALQMLRSRMQTVADKARGEYGDGAVDSLMSEEIPQSQVQREDWRDRYPDLADKVVMGQLDEDRAATIADRLDQELGEEPPARQEQEQPPAREYDEAAHREQMRDTNRELYDLGFFNDMTEAQVAERAQKELVPLVDEMVIDLDLDWDDPGVRHRTIMRAAKQIMSREQKPPQSRPRHTNKPLKRGEGTAPPAQSDGDPANWDDVLANCRDRWRNQQT